MPSRRVPVRLAPLGSTLTGAVPTWLALPGTAAAMAIAAARRMVARPDSRRVIRGVLLTPWSAVSIGIVVAASLTLAAPRAVLTFPPSSAARCQATGCGPTGGLGASPLPAAKLGVKFPPIRPGPANGASGGLSSSKATLASPGSVRVQYAVLPRDGAHFVAVIFITSRRALGDWTLRFVIPGTQIKLVMFAKWTPRGQDGGIVGAPPWSSEPSGANRARVVILGTGAPGRPRGCVFDGVRCSFRDFSGGVNHFDWQPGQEGGR